MVTNDPDIAQLLLDNGANAINNSRVLDSFIKTIKTLIQNVIY